MNPRTVVQPMAFLPAAYVQLVIRYENALLTSV